MRTGPGGGGSLEHGPGCAGAQLAPGHVDAELPSSSATTAAVAAGGVGLALERPQLAAHLAQQVLERGEVALGGGQPALGLLPAAAELQHAGRLLDDSRPVLGPGVEHGVELALADDHVLLATDAGVAQQLLDVEEPARHPVDGVLAVTASGTASG